MDGKPEKKNSSEAAGNPDEAVSLTGGKIWLAVAYALIYILFAVLGFVRKGTLFIGILSAVLLLIAVVNLFFPKAFFSVRRLFLLKFKEFGHNLPGRFQKVSTISGRTLLAISMLLALLFACGL